ncbi:hypothetical protein FACS189454_05890 [Planctomycetales bacterium]|nr:hypothetical protein FACS189454_05890 [Planctomycetales bacterium]
MDKIESTVISLQPKNVMKAETEKLLNETIQDLFHSDRFKPIRDVMNLEIPNRDKVEDLDVLLDRVDKFAPGMQAFADYLGKE